MYKKFWEFRNLSEEEAELLLYGDIASELAVGGCRRYRYAAEIL